MAVGGPTCIPVADSGEDDQRVDVVWSVAEFIGWACDTVDGRMSCWFTPKEWSGDAELG